MHSKNKGSDLKKGKTKYEQPKIIRKYKEEELAPERMQVKAAPPITTAVAIS